MTKRQEILNPEEYRHYREVRAIAVLFTLVGGVCIFAALAQFLELTNSKEHIHPAILVVALVIGIISVIGGIATLRGNRRWAFLTYLLGTVYILQFPFGTLMGYVILKGLPRYLDSVERVRSVANRAG
jgi:hypothetical protein